MGLQNFDVGLKFNSQNKICKWVCLEFTIIKKLYMFQCLLATS